MYSPIPYELYLDQVCVHGLGAAGARGEHGGRQLRGRQAACAQRRLGARQLIAHLDATNPAEIVV